MVGEELQRNRVDGGGLEVGYVAWHGDYGHSIVVFEPSLGVCEYDQLAAAGAHFHQIRLELLEQVVVRRDGDHRHVGVDQPEWPWVDLAPRTCRAGVRCGSLDL